MAEIPEHLLKRSQAARAKAAGGEGEAGAAEDKPAEEKPAEGESGAKIPEHLLKRAAAARAKAKGEEPPEAGDGGGGAAPAAAAGKTAVKVAPAGAPARTQRLLAVVKAGSIQQTKVDPVDKVNTWPHLLVIEFAALLICTAALIIFSLLVNAPLQAQANFNQTPNPSKAPWYFLGLQELLTLFNPMVAGVMIPGIGIFGLLVVPYIDRNPSTKPSERKFAIAVFTFFLMYWALLVLFGSFFRGEGFNFVWPWKSGIFFDF